MKLHLLITTFLLFLFGSVSAQINTVGIIGTATPGGWDIDTDMERSSSDDNVWTLQTTLEEGVLKFRANDDWEINWGSDAQEFPNGTGYSGQADIQVVAGEYLITFNSETGVYSFEAPSTPINSIGIIGTATPGGWDTDTDMEKSPLEDDIWFIQITLTDGVMKFRANDNWDINWGSNAQEFPAGYGYNNEADINVRAGDYFITFNSTTGEYLFDFAGEIGVIGSASPLGWDRDIFMISDIDNEDQFSVTLNLSIGEVKFRADGMWDDDWGGTDFPAGIAVYKGPNLLVPSAGRYHIKFNRSTLEYSFDEIVTLGSVGLVGTATPGGTDEATLLTKSPSNPEIWSGDITLTDGTFTFVSDDATNIVWGGTDFPAGVAVVDGDEIQATPGKYIVTFNSNSLEYSFVEVVTYETVGIFGDATPEGWDSATPMIKNPDNESEWSLRAKLNDGSLYFMGNNDWEILWGSGEFPTGTAIVGGPVIPIPQGEYRINFNSTTGVYNFEEIIEFSAVSVVGKSGPFLAWPEENDGGAKDTYMNKNPEDGNIWTLNSITLIDYNAADDGGIKFRAETAWAINWGAVDFPKGVGTLSGPNIEPVAGTYSVFFNASTGEYVFSDPVSSREQVLSADVVSLSPNPAYDWVNVEINSEKIQGEIVIKTFGINGQLINTSKFGSTEGVKLNVASLNAGTYFIQISNGKTLVGKKLVVVK